MRTTSVEDTGARAHEPCTVLIHRTSKDDALLRRARGDYREMPAMRLTIEQAMRLWDLDRHHCQSLLDSLVENAGHEVEILLHPWHPSGARGLLQAAVKGPFWRRSGYGCDGRRCARGIGGGNAVPACRTPAHA